MKKKIILLFILLLTVFTTTGCDKKVEPNLEQLREISNWVTLEAEYHNVAKIEKKKGEGLLHIGELDRKMWIEYVGVIKIGVEADKIKMNINKDKIKIKMPKPSVLFINYKDYNKDSYYTSKDSWFNKNQISYQDINTAMKDADEKMLNEVNSNDKVFEEAKNNLEVLMSNYINKVGELSGKKYVIEYVYE